MLKPYRPEYFPEVERFARKLGNFGYVKTIIRLHLEEKRPGGCFVWTVGKRIAAFCAVNYLNRDDAWLYGMRVDRDCHNHNIATRATRELMAMARADGRTWAGLNTSDTPSHRPVFRIAEKLGMRQEGIFANDVFWKLRIRGRAPGIRRHPDIFREFVRRNRSVFFHQTPGWFWSRLLPGRRRGVNRNGRIVHGVPVLIERIAQSGRLRGTAVNLLELPEDVRPLLRGLFHFARGRDWLVINYPAEWRPLVRRVWRRMLPSLRPGRRCWPATERVYGREL